MKRLGLLTIAALLAPPQAQAQLAPISECVALVLARSAPEGELDQVTLEALDRFLSMSWITRDPRYVMAIYAPETRCHTDACSAEHTLRREQTISAHFVGRGIAAGRIRLIGLDEGFSLFGRMPERAAIVIVQAPGVAMPSCETGRIGRSD